MVVLWDPAPLAEDHPEAESVHGLALAAEQRHDVLVLLGGLVHQKH